MIVDFEKAKGSNLVRGNVYKAGSNGNFSDDPISNLFPKLGNQSGFRKKLCENANGRNIPGEWAYVALQTTGGVSDWPDSLDEETGIFTYYGDQYDASKNILDTKQKGNLLLQNVFEWLHTGQLEKIPPFFVFQNASEGSRDTRFLGLAVPGNPDIASGEDLKLATDVDGNVKNNYVAKFTILDTSDSPITYEWLKARITDTVSSFSLAPDAWKAFIKSKEYDASGKSDKEIVNAIEEEIEALGVDGETRQALLNVRVNQSVFRKRLLKRYDSCCLCNVTKEDHLRASHIKPWSVSEPKEKLDVDNGLLLCPNHDSLFDKGHISFDDDGSIIISSQLDMTNRAFMNVTESMKIAVIEGNKKYLDYHRKNVFKG